MRIVGDTHTQENINQMYGGRKGRPGREPRPCTSRHQMFKYAQGSK